MPPICVGHVCAAIPLLATVIIGAGGSDGSTPPAGRLRFTAVSAGGRHTCGVTAAGAAYCWGTNGSGQLGDGTTTERSSAMLVVGGLSFTAVHSTGSWGGDDGHTCGVTAGGAVYCWGDNSDGELGDGTTTGRLSPVPVGGGVSFAALSAGYVHNCGVTAAGPAYCWGGNSAGELGDGTTTGRLRPVPVGGGHLTAVSAGLLYTCGLTAAGVTYCWGFNRHGQLGNAVSGQESCARTSSCSTVAGGLTFVAVSAGGFHTCGITAAGAAYCWGNNSRGRLGDGSTTNQSRPVLVAGGLRFVAVTAGGFHSCGVTAAGAAYCWGDNRSGQLGDGTTMEQSSPVPVAGGL